MNHFDIKALREALELTQEELAQRLGVSRNTIINYEKGGVIPESKRQMLEALSNHPDVTTKAPYVDNVTMPREVFDQITRLTETVLSQQRTIETLAAKKTQNADDQRRAAN